MIDVDSPSFRRDEPRVQAPSPLQVGWGQPLTTLPRCRWEYLTLHARGSAVNAVDGDHNAPLAQTPIWQALGTLGRDEWELVAVHQADEGERGLVYIFKRAASAQSA